jgi:hypothetical protein
MKKLILPALALPLLIVCCTKEASMQTTSQPSVINVAGISPGMSISGTRFTANEVMTASYNVAGADSIRWYMQDSIPYYPDSNYHYPGGDTTVYNPGDTVVTYPDTIPGYPGGDTIPHYPGDTIPSYPSQDTIPNYPGGDTLVTYPDTIPGYPGGDTLVTYPGSDTLINYPGTDSSGSHGNSYVLTVQNKTAEIRISKRGSYVLVANAYRRNANGTYTLISRGYIQFKAY